MAPTIAATGIVPKAKFPAELGIAGHAMYSGHGVQS